MAAHVWSFSFVQQWMNLLALLKYGLVFSILLVFLPLTAFKGVPLHGMLGGLFVDLTKWEIFFVTLALLGVAWCVMFSEGLIVSAVESFWRRGPAYRTYANVVRAPTGYVPAWSEKFFCVPVTRPQLVFFTLLTVPGLWVIAQHGSDGVWRGLLALAGGGIAAYALLIVLSAPAALVDWNNRPMIDLPLADRVWLALASIGPLVALARGVHHVASFVVRRLHLRYVLEPPDAPRMLNAPHFNALTSTIGLAAVVAFVALVFSPSDLRPLVEPAGSRSSGENQDSQSAKTETPVPSEDALPDHARSFPRQLPSVVYLFVIVMALVLAFTGLQLHLGRLRISPLLVVLVVMLIGYSTNTVDHYYRVVDTSPPAERLTPVAVAKSGVKGPNSNLVVVVASGGGILAAAWTTLALEKLTDARPALLQEIRLLSTISGGSVGAAYFIDSLLRREPPGHAYVKSTESSLAATAYGFAFLDVPRLLTGGLASPSRDRGLLLEQEWLDTANGSVRGTRVQSRAAALTDRPLQSLREAIVQGTIPAPIFAATIMESGRRVMVTPIDFSGTPGQSRGETLSEYLSTAPGLVDVSLWTAARLSATFAFVSPAARADGPKGKDKALPTDHRAQHLIDGGYYDNFGVTSALDWLNPVLEARLSGPDLAFTRVLIIQLRAFRRGNPREVRAASGAGAALLGPLIGLGAIRDGAAVSRNDIELARFVKNWTERFRESKPSVQLCIATLEPEQGTEGPLSWHLTADDKKQLRKGWSPAQTTKVTDYLEGKPCADPVN